MDFILTLQNEKEAFSADLDPKYILPSLSRSGVITDDEYERIDSKTEKQDRFNELFSLLTSGLKTFTQLRFFVDALEEKDEDGCLPYPWLAEKLKPALKLDYDVHKSLVRGNVRLPVNHLLPQEKKIQNIRKELKKASEYPNSSKWVVLHGPIGSGKSSLAAEAVRVNYLIKEHFSDGVFWLDFGSNKINCTNELDSDSNKINRTNKWERICDEKIKNILKLLDNNYIFSPDDDLTYLLRNAVIGKKVLFILVEVSHESIIKRFDIEGVKLVTTNLKNLMVGVSCEFIECPNDAQNADIKLLLSKYVNCEPDDLPDVVQKICDKCGRSLLVASLIGGSMSNVGNDEETWNYWNTKLEESGLAGLRKNIDEKDVLNVIVNCIEHIDEWKEYYFDLVIFKKGSFVSSEVLEIVWNNKKENEPAIFHIAVQLYQRSFVVMKESEPRSKFSCCSHDLYIDAVSQHLGPDKIKELHRKFVDKVFELGGLSDGTVDLTKLPKDYIPTFIDYHLYQAGKRDVLEKLYLDLKFVEQKICLMDDCRSILDDYETYKDCFSNKEDAKNFKLFLRRNGKRLLREEKCDIIQLALFEPHDSIVYKKAKEFAIKNKGLYYDWCNNIENIHNFEILSCSNIKFGAINQDASLVAFIDGFKPEESMHASWMKVRHLPSSNELIEKNTHNDVINYCAFSSKGDYLATASADATVKIFKMNVSFPKSYNFMMKNLSLKESVQDIKLGNLFLTFTEHNFEVVCCSFSSNDRYVISSDVTGITLVWKFNALDGDSPPLRSAEVCHALETEPLRFSSLSYSGNTIGTAVYDTIKLWDFETEEEKKTFCCKDRIIKKFIFTDDDSRILIVLDNAILIWEVESNNQQTIFTDKSYKICCCCLSTSGKYIACGMESGQIIIIIIQRKENKVLPGHNDEIVNVMFSEDETKLFSISPTRCIIRNVSGIENTPLVSGSLSVVMGEEPIIASSVTSSSVEIRKGQLVTASNILGVKISTFSLSNDGSEIVIGTEQGSVKVFNINEKSSVELPQKHSGKITYILHSKNNDYFFTCSVDATIKVWRKRTHHVTLCGHQKSVLMCAEFKTCNKLLSCCEDGSLRVWNTDSGGCIDILDKHPYREITCCDISCNDAFLAAAFANGNIMIWRAGNGDVQQDFSLEKMGFKVRCCQFSPATDLLIAGLNDGCILQCHIRGRGTCYPLDSKHKSAVSSIRMINERDPVDKPLFLTASKSIKLWDRDSNLLQTIFFPNSALGDECTRIWASENFKVLTVSLNCILYILRRID